MSKSATEKVSSADESASDVNKDKFEKGSDKQSEEESVTSNDKEFTDSESAESYSSENEESERVSCHVCEKKFANKRSLASHKSRFHRDLINKKNVHHASRNEINDSLSSRYGKGFQASNDKQSTIASTPESDSSLPSSNNGFIVKNFPCHYCDKSFANKHRLRSHKNRFHYNKKLNSSSESEEDDNMNKGDSDEHSDFSTNDSTTRKGHSLKRKKGTNIAVFNATLTKILDSMRQILQSKNFNDEEDCFDLLFCYQLKNELFAGLEEYIMRNHELDIKIALSEDELSLVNAVLSTKSLIELKQLLNENTKIVKSIIEQHVLTKRKKHDDESS